MLAAYAATAAGSSPFPRLRLVADSDGDPDLFFIEALPGSEFPAGSFYLDPRGEQKKCIITWLRAAAEAFLAGRAVRPLGIIGLIKARSCMHGLVHLDDHHGIPRAFDMPCLALLLLLLAGGAGDAHLAI